MNYRFTLGLVNPSNSKKKRKYSMTELEKLKRN